MAELVYLRVDVGFTGTVVNPWPPEFFGPVLSHLSPIASPSSIASFRVFLYTHSEGWLTWSRRKR